VNAARRSACATHSSIYIGNVRTEILSLALIATASIACAADLKPETSAAYDRYIKLVEAELAARSTPKNFLWLDSHPKEKSQVWLSQSIMEPRETLDHGEKIDIPDGVVQHWFGAVYLETATFDRLRDMLADFPSYKSWFGPQVIDSRLVKRDGDTFYAFLRLNKKQVTQVVLNADLKADWVAIDPNHGMLSVRSTRIGEALHPRNKKTYEQELPADEQNGYLWRLNIYWRFEHTDVGVYLEMDLISLARASGALHPGRYLNGFQTFPGELAARLFEAIQLGFPAPHK
jgi:hypothetical protein